MNREAKLRLPCLTTFLWIPATVLGSRSISKWNTRRVEYWSGSRSQIPNRVEDRLVEFIQLSPLQSPVEHLTYITASPSKFDVILIVGHGVLDTRE